MTEAERIEFFKNLKTRAYKHKIFCFLGSCAEYSTTFDDFLSPLKYEEL